MGNKRQGGDLPVWLDIPAPWPGLEGLPSQEMDCMVLGLVPSDIQNSL